MMTQANMDVANSDAYYVVGKKKLIIMSIATLGLFTIYWSYKNWHVIKKNNNLNIWPVFRAIFSPIFVYSLANHIHEECEVYDCRIKFSPSQIGLGYLIASFAYGIFTFIFVGPMQDSAAKLNEVKGLKTKDNSKITHWVFLLIYLYLFISAIGIILELLTNGINL